MKYLILCIFLIGCSATEIPIPDKWTDYEYRVGENSYIAFTNNPATSAAGVRIRDGHFYRVWYNQGKWGETAHPNVKCSGDYIYDGVSLTILPYEGEGITYQIADIGGGEYSMQCGADCAYTWARTKKNHYIKKSE